MLCSYHEILSNSSEYNRPISVWRTILFSTRNFTLFRYCLLQVDSLIRSSFIDCGHQIQRSLPPFGHHLQKVPLLYPRDNRNLYTTCLIHVCTELMYNNIFFFSSAIIEIYFVSQRVKASVMKSGNAYYFCNFYSTHTAQ